MHGPRLARAMQESRCMHIDSSLSELISLNWLSEEARHVTAGSAQDRLIHEQMEQVRAHLPRSLLSFHDRLAKQGRPSAMRASGNSCPACHLRLPRSLQADLCAERSSVVCPNCGVIVWHGPVHASPTVDADAAQTA